MLKGVARREFDLVAAPSVDRLGRSLPDLLNLLSELHRGIGLYLNQQGLDTTTPSGQTMYQVMAVLAEFERAMLVDRVKAGLARARASGKKLGRSRLPDQVVGRIRHELEAGRGIHSTARRLGVGTVQQVDAELRPERKWLVGPLGHGYWRPLFSFSHPQHELDYPGLSRQELNADMLSAAPRDTCLYRTTIGKDESNVLPINRIAAHSDLRSISGHIFDHARKHSTLGV